MYIQNQKIKTILNYIGQLRIYSFLDLIVFATALTSRPSKIAGISLLWLGCLIYSESRHQDPLRTNLNRFLWVIPFLVSFILIPFWICLVVFLCSYFYTKKKNGWWGVVSPIWRGLINTVIALGFKPSLAFLVFILMFLRNLAGDLRDVYFDRKRGIKTIPVIIGIKRNLKWAYYLHLLLVITTTTVWFHFSFLNKSFLPLIITLELISYPLTPRLNNPKFLDLYQKQS